MAPLPLIFASTVHVFRSLTIYGMQNDVTETLFTYSTLLEMGKYVNQWHCGHDIVMQFKIGELLLPQSLGSLH